MATNIKDLDKDELLEKYKDVLKYCCYNDDKLCNELSVSCNYICTKCITNNKQKENIDINKIKENYINKEYIIYKTIKEYLTECDTFENKSPEEEKKVYKTKICFNIYKILYYNPIFNIISAKFLIAIIKKIDELINAEESFFSQFLKNNSEYKFIHKYMTDINNFCKEYENINKISLNYNIKIEDYNKFLDEYVKFISNICECVIHETNIYKNINNIYKNINKQEDVNIDIDNLCECSFVLDI